jgi:hypothetical protein
MKRNKINHRVDEPDNPYAFQITFRTSGKLSAQWSSLRGLCKKYGHDERTPELFREVLLPAMKAYVAQRGYIDRAKEERLAKRRISG